MYKNIAKYERPISALTKKPIDDKVFESYKRLSKWMEEGYHPIAMNK